MHCLTCQIFARSPLFAHPEILVLHVLPIYLYWLNIRTVTTEKKQHAIITRFFYLKHLEQLCSLHLWWRVQFSI
jgi:hypothetical protein